MQRGQVLTADKLEALISQTRAKTTSLTDQLADTARADHADISAQADKLVGRGEDPWRCSWSVTISAPGKTRSDAELAAHAYRGALESAGSCGETDYRLVVTNLSSKLERGKVRLRAEVRVRHHSSASADRVHERLQAARDAALDKKLTNAWAEAVPSFIDKTLRQRAASADVLSDKVLAPITIAKVDYEGGEKLKAVPGMSKVPFVTKEDPTNHFVTRLQQRLTDVMAPRGFNVRLSRHVGDLVVYFDGRTRAA